MESNPRFLMSKDICNPPWLSMHVDFVTAPVPALHRRGGFPQHAAGDDDLLDLAGTFVDPEQPDIPVEALDGIIGDIAGAAMDLHRALGHAADHLAGEELAAGGEGGGRRGGRSPPAREGTSSPGCPPRPAESGP